MLPFETVAGDALVPSFCVALLFATGPTDVCVSLVSAVAVSSFWLTLIEVIFSFASEDADVDGLFDTSVSTLPSDLSASLDATLVSDLSCPASV
ncbi:Uncharacterised protein [Staphylococcus aureus]|nr:Uncharacterised protein [Staphylococcus aureus]